MDFSGKVALVTGAAGGIGRATSVAFAGHGAKLVLVDRDEAGGEETLRAVREAGAEARFVAADVSRTEDVRRYVREAVNAFGTIDCFFNNAGIEGTVVPLVDYEEAMFDQVIAVNLKGVFLGLREVLPVMLQRKSGAIVNTASTAGMMGSPGLSAYVASKHGVMGLTKSAAGEVARDGVRVNAVCPGPIDTRMIRSLERQADGGEQGRAAQRYRDSIPLGRYGTANEVANVVLFLCSDLSSGVTGAHYPVDGGRTATTASVRTAAQQG